MRPRRKMRHLASLRHLFGVAMTALAPRPKDRASSEVSTRPALETDSVDIAAEPRLPPHWSPARAEHDRRQAEMVAGLLAGYRRHRTAGP